MPAGVVKNARDERHWTMAKEQAAKQGHAKDYAYIMGIFKRMSKAEKIRGGLGDNKPDSDFDPEQLAAGIKVEREHTKDPAIAREIARDHLTEDPAYYRKLKRMEKGDERTPGEIPKTAPQTKIKIFQEDAEAQGVPPGTRRLPLTLPSRQEKPYPKLPQARASKSEAPMSLVKSVLGVDRVANLATLSPDDQLQALRVLRKAGRVLRETFERAVLRKARAEQQGLFGSHPSMNPAKGKMQQTSMFGGAGGGSGEGSRGGKVIGHTTSGKPIYDAPGHPAHGKFNAGERQEAETTHRAHGWEPIPESKEGGWRRKGAKIGTGPSGPVHEYEHSYPGGEKQPGLFGKATPIQLPVAKGARLTPDPAVKGTVPDPDLSKPHLGTWTPGGIAPGTGAAPGGYKPGKTTGISDAAAAKMGMQTAQPRESSTTIQRSLTKSLSGMSGTEQLVYLRELRKAKGTQLGLFGQQALPGTGGGGEAPKPKTAPTGRTGEGSRGGKVIGHTTGGKPIYDSHDHPGHAGFTAGDHHDAAALHDRKARTAADAPGTDWRNPEASGHRLAANDHRASEHKLDTAAALAPVSKQAMREEGQAHRAEAKEPKAAPESRSGIDPRMEGLTDMSSRTSYPQARRDFRYTPESQGRAKAHSDLSAHYREQAGKHGGSWADSLVEAARAHTTAADRHSKKTFDAEGSSRAAGEAGAKHHDAMIAEADNARNAHIRERNNLENARGPDKRVATPAGDVEVGDLHHKAAEAYAGAKAAHLQADPRGGDPAKTLKHAKDAAKKQGQADWLSRRAHHGDGYREAKRGADELYSMAVHPANEGQREEHLTVARKYEEAAQKHADAVHSLRGGASKEGRKVSDGALKAHAAAKEAHQILSGERKPEKLAARKRPKTAADHSRIASLHNHHANKAEEAAGITGTPQNRDALRADAAAHSKAAGLHWKAADAHKEGHESAGEATAAANAASAAAPEVRYWTGAGENKAERPNVKIRKSMQPGATVPPGKDPLMKKADPKAAAQAQAAQEEQKQKARRQASGAPPPPYQANGGAQNGQNGQGQGQGQQQGAMGPGAGPGDEDYHRDKALAHLRAAQAHANAHHSAKQLAQAGDHHERVNDAEAASMDAVGDQGGQAIQPPGQQPQGQGQPGPGQFKKSEGEGSRGGRVIGHTAGGKPIYQSDVPSKFDPAAGTSERAQFHEDQARTHRKLRREHLRLQQDPATSEGDSAAHFEAAGIHAKAATMHDAAAETGEAAPEREQKREQYTDSAVKFGTQAHALSRKLFNKSMPVQKDEDPRTIKKGNLYVDLNTADDAAVALLEKGGAIGADFSTAPDPWGPQRTAAMRGERIVKGQFSGGTVYQGELEGEPRGGDMRESATRLVTEMLTVEDDPAGNRGQGGLDGWFRDAYDPSPEVRVPLDIRARAGFDAPSGETFGHVITKSAPEIQVIDDSDPYQRALARSDPRDGQAGMRLQYQGDPKNR
jgi:hypothetical protein